MQPPCDRALGGAAQIKRSYPAASPSQSNVAHRRAHAPRLDIDVTMRRCLPGTFQTLRFRCALVVTKGVPLPHLGSRSRTPGPAPPFSPEPHAGRAERMPGHWLSLTCPRSVVPRGGLPIARAAGSIPSRRDWPHITTFTVFSRRRTTNSCGHSCAIRPSECARSR